MGEYGRAKTRNQTFDVLRAAALVSMVSYHVALLGAASHISRLLHAAVWIDGAFFFVALSGVVTGLVHRRLVARGGFVTSARKLARRAGFLYVVHLVLAALIITAHSTNPSVRIPFTPTWSDGPGSTHTLAELLTLHTQPDFTGVLPMYVIFLLWAIVAVYLFRRGRYRTVIALSISIYVAGRLLDSAALTPDAFQVTAWQLLFTGGLLVGWTWEHERHRLSLEFRHNLVVGAAVVSATLFGLARLAKGPVTRLPGALVDKSTGGLLAFLFAAAALVLAYAAVDRLGRCGRARRPLAAIGLAGSKGLPGYVAMVLCVLALQLMPGVPRNDLVVVAVAVICGTTEAVAFTLDARRRRREQRRATRAIDMPRPSQEPLAVT